MLALSQDPLLTPPLPALLLQLVPEIEANDIVILRASIFFWSHQTWPSPLNQSVLRQSYTNTFQMRELIACNRPRTLRKRSEEHTSELQSIMSIQYAVYCLKQKK